MFKGADDTFVRNRGPYSDKTKQRKAKRKKDWRKIIRYTDSCCTRFRLTNISEVIRNHAKTKYQ